MPTNREGLTFGEWLRAALFLQANAIYSMSELRQAWINGEDPTEYAFSQR